MGWPTPQYQRVGLLYRNEDGTWPEVPDNHFLGGWFISADGRRERDENDPPDMVGNGG